MTDIDSTIVRDGDRIAASPWFSKLLANAAETLGVTISEARIRNYAALLEDCPAADIRSAIPYLLQNGGPFLPAVSEIRAACGLLGTTDRAVLAWAAVMRAASEAGAYLSVAFEDGAIAAAIETVWGSWPHACEEIGDGPAAHVRRQEFLAAYRAASARRQESRRLVGLCESSDGYALDGKRWTATLTAGGTIVAHRDAPSVASGIARKPVTR